MWNIQVHSGHHYNTPPWLDIRPNSWVKLMCDDFLSAFVNISTKLYSMLIYYRSKIPFFTWLCKKWTVMSICFVQAWNSGLWAIDIADWLSEKIVGVIKEKSNSMSNERYHKTCFATWAAAMALGVDGATVVCFFEL